MFKKVAPVTKRPDAKDIPPGLFVQKGDKPAARAGSAEPRPGFKPRVVPADVVDVDVVEVNTPPAPREKAPVDNLPPQDNEPVPPLASVEPESLPLPDDGPGVEPPVASAQPRTFGFNVRKKAVEPAAASDPADAPTAPAVEGADFLKRFRSSAKSATPPAKPATAGDEGANQAPALARLQQTLQRLKRATTRRTKADAPPAKDDAGSELVSPVSRPLLAGVTLAALCSVASWQYLKHQNDTAAAGIAALQAQLGEAKSTYAELLPKAVRSSVTTQQIDLAGATRRAALLWAPGLTVDLQVAPNAQAFLLVPAVGQSQDPSNAALLTDLRGLLAHPQLNGCLINNLTEGSSRVTVTCQTDSSRAGSGERRGALSGLR